MADAGITESILWALEVMKEQFCGEFPFVALQTDIRSATEQFAIVGVFVIFAWQNELMY